MRLTFFDPVPWDYCVDTPLEEGLGGSQSAACYLAEELATRGHDVVFINGIEEPRMSHGVRFIGRGSRDEDLIIDKSDALIVINAAIGQRIRKTGIKTPMVLWSGHDADQEAVADLKWPKERNAWNRVVVGSEYQRARYTSAFGSLPMSVIGLAIAPPFLNEPLQSPWHERGIAPVLAYTSTPFRGLDRLLDAFPEIREAVPGVRLRIYSDMRVYRADDAPYQPLYAKARDMYGVEYVGSIGQRELARQLAGCAVLTLPSTFPETYCVAAVEAASVGAVPLVTPLGALNEVLGWAALYTTHSDYGRAVINVVAALHDERMIDARMKAAQRIRRECCWSMRAVQWEILIEGVK